MASGMVVAVVGVTGAVGQTTLKILEERKFPVRALRAFASARSAGSPQIPLPVMRIVPNPSRATRRSFPIRNSPTFAASPCP